MVRRRREVVAILMDGRDWKWYGKLSASKCLIVQVEPWCNHGRGQLIYLVTHTL